MYSKLIKSLLNDREFKISGNELHCCCPFHNEQQPSFSINLAKGCYHCFSCGSNGSITNFVANMKNISTKTAWKHIKKYKEKGIL